MLCQSRGCSCALDARDGELSRLLISTHSPPVHSLPFELNTTERIFSPSHQTPPLVYQMPPEQFAQQYRRHRRQYHLRELKRASFANFNGGLNGGQQHPGGSAAGGSGPVGRTGSYAGPGAGAATSMGGLGGGGSSGSVASSTTSGGRRAGALR